MKAAPFIGGAALYACWSVPSRSERLSHRRDRERRQRIARRRAADRG